MHETTKLVWGGPADGSGIEEEAYNQPQITQHDSNVANENPETSIKLSSHVTASSLTDLFELKTKLLCLIKLLKDAPLTRRLALCIRSQMVLPELETYKTLNEVAYRFLWREIFAATSMHDILTFVQPWHLALQMYKFIDVELTEGEKTNEEPEKDVQALDLQSRFAMKSYPEEILCIGQPDLRNEMIDTFESLAGLSLSEYQKFRIQQLAELGPSKSLQTISTARLMHSVNEAGPEGRRVNRLLLEDYVSESRNQQWLKDLSSRAAAVDSNNPWARDDLEGKLEMRALMKGIDFDGKLARDGKSDGEGVKREPKASGRAARLANRNQKGPEVVVPIASAKGRGGRAKGVKPEGRRVKTEGTDEVTIHPYTGPGSKGGRPRKNIDSHLATAGGGESTASEEPPIFSKRTRGGAHVGGGRGESGRGRGRGGSRRHLEASRSSSPDRITGGEPTSTTGRGARRNGGVSGIPARRITRASTRKGTITDGTYEESDVQVDPTLGNTSDDSAQGLKKRGASDSQPTDSVVGDDPPSDHSLNDQIKRRRLTQPPVARLRYVTRASQRGTGRKGDSPTDAASDDRMQTDGPEQPQNDIPMTPLIEAEANLLATSEPVLPADKTMLEEPRNDGDEWSNEDVHQE